MDIEITSRPAYSVAHCTIAAGESVRAEGGAMMAMTANVAIETSTGGGLMRGLKRSVLGGESFFMNTFTAQGEPGRISFAPPLAGDIVQWHLSNETVYLQSGSFLAAPPGIEVDSRWGGAKTFFSGEGLFMLRCTGTGPLLVSSYGAIETIDLPAGAQMVADTGHLVGWSEDIGFNVRKVGGWKSTFFSGEGLVVDLTGPGRVHLQTRSQSAFLSWLLPQLPRNNSSS